MPQHAPVPPVLPPPRRARPPHVHRLLSRVCVPAARARPPSFCQAVHLFAVRPSAGAFTGPYARSSSSCPPAVLAVPDSARAPDRPRACGMHTLLPCPQPAPVNLAVTDTAPALAPTALATRPPPDRLRRACACVSPVTRHPSIGTAYTRGLCHVIACSTWVPKSPRHARYTRLRQTGAGKARKSKALDSIA